MLTDTDCSEITDRYGACHHDALREAYRRGMLRAAEVCQGVATFKVEGSVMERSMATVMNAAANQCAVAILAEAGDV